MGGGFTIVPTRREVLCFTVAAATLATAVPGTAGATNGVSQAIAAFTGGETPQDGVVVIEAPDIADNGGAVPIRVVAPGARRIALFADGNPNPGVSIVSFGRLAMAEATIRIRLAGSQNLIAVAEMADGAFHMTLRPIAVTVGGCA